jgi:hypothetical protein
MIDRRMWIRRPIILDRSSHAGLINFDKALSLQWYSSCRRSYHGRRLSGLLIWTQSQSFHCLKPPGAHKASDLYKLKDNGDNLDHLVSLKSWVTLGLEDLQGHPRMTQLPRGLAFPLYTCTARRTCLLRCMHHSLGFIWRSCASKSSPWAWKGVAETSGAILLMVS